MAEKSGFEPSVSWGARQRGFQPLEVVNTGLAAARVRIVLPRLQGRVAKPAGEAVGGAAGDGWAVEVRCFLAQLFWIG